MYCIDLESPIRSDLELLMTRHKEAMHANSPPESIHMMDAKSLEAPNIRFFVMRDPNQHAVGMGAVKILDTETGEIKSMHILEEMRGKGLSKMMLNHLIDAAQTEGLHQLNLETGSQTSFEVARQLYEKAGFEYCGPFGDYMLDPSSVFMTIDISNVRSGCK
jgi:putative acetyltransferase